jgi:hypothetical protein
MLANGRPSLLLRSPLSGSLPLLLAGLSLAGSEQSHAVSPAFDFGFENQIHSQTATPQYFPVVSAGARIDSKKEADSLDSDSETLGDVKFRISPTHPRAFAITSQNLYTGIKDRSENHRLRLSIGRRHVGWSSLDSLWGLGQVEPFDNWDRLRPSAQGLTGVFAHADTAFFDFRFFASYVALPEIMPNVVIDDQKQILSEHPQSINSAPKSFTLLGKPVPIGYNLELPPLQNILLRPALLGQMETKRELPFFAKIGFGYLPMNYFPVALVASLPTEVNSVVATLTPRLLSHRVYIGEGGYRFSRKLEAGIGVLIDEPLQDVLPANYTSSQITSSVSTSPWIRMEFKRIKLQLAHLIVTGGVGPDLGPLAGSGPNFMSSRLLYRNASQISLKWALDGSLRGSEFQFKYIHEYSVRGDWFAGDFFYPVNPRMGLIAGGDLLSAYESAAPDRGAEFLSDMRTLGRVRLGVNYAL